MKSLQVEDLKEMICKMQIPGSGIKALWAGNRCIMFCHDTSLFDVYGEKNGNPLLEGAFNEVSTLEMFSNCDIEVENQETPW